MTQASAEHEQYQRIKLLGEGSFGKAYLVKCLSDDSQCVIKQVDLSGMDDKEMRDTLNEAKILEVLNHPNIVKFREVYKTKKGKLCIVMDYADGGDLTGRIKAQKNHYFSENQILDWFTQICLGLKHVHDRKILHRDLKAQNVFLTKANIIKLGDFGIARVLSGTQDNAKTMVGTPYYLSPEIINGKPYNYKSDIWSLGVLLYELCALKPPFDAKNLPFLALKIVKGQYAPIPVTYSKGLKDLVNSLFKVNPKERPSINNILNMPIIQDRIKRYLSETTRFREFSKTFLKNQNFSLNDLKLEDVRNIDNEHHVPPHVIMAQKEREMEKEFEKDIERESVQFNQAEQSPASLKPPGQMPGNQPSSSPILRPVMHHRKSPSNSPMMQGRQIIIEGDKHLISPLTRLRQMGGPNKLEPIQNLPPIHSPQLNSGYRSPAQNTLMSSVGHLKPLMENRDKQNFISAQNFLNPQSEYESRHMKESPQYNVPKVVRDRSRNSENKDPSGHSPSIQLPSLNRSRNISQSPNLGPLVAKPKQMDSALPQLNIKGSGTPVAPDSGRGKVAGRIIVKREALKNFDKVAPSGEYIVPRNIELEFSPRPLMKQEPLSGYIENTKDQFSDSDDELEKLQAVVAQKGERSKQAASDPKAKKDEGEGLVVVGHRLRFNSGAEEEILCQGKDMRSGESTPNIRLIAPLVHHNVEEDIYRQADKTSPILTRKPRKGSEDVRHGDDQHFGKVTAKELHDMESMAVELNRIIVDLEADMNQHSDTPSYGELPSDKHEEAILTRNDHRYEDREDDPNEMHNEREVRNKEKPVSGFPFEFRGNQDMRKKLEAALGQEKFNSTYLIVKDLVDKHEDANFDEEKVEYYAKIFPFLNRDEIEKYLFNVFTFVVMEGWMNAKRP